MAGKHIKQMIAAYRDGDDLAFRRAAQAIIEEEEEEARRHPALAREMRQLLATAAGHAVSVDITPVPNPPMDSERDMPLADIASPRRYLRDLVLDEPLSRELDLRWEHACTTVNIEAGEDIRRLPRTKAADLMLPGADCFVFDHRVVRWNFQRGDGTNPRHYTFSSDPPTIRDIVAAFELAWNRATPHAEYKPD